MSVLADFFSKISIWEIITGLVSIFGFLFGIYGYRKKSEGQLVFQFFTQDIISENINKLSQRIAVSYDNKEVNSLSLTHIILWNKGGSPIVEKNISDEYPLNFIFEENVRVLDVEILKVTNKANMINATINKENYNKFNYKFKYLNHGDGALFKVLHTKSNTGLSSEGAVVGMIKQVLNLGKISVDIVSSRKGVLGKLFSNNKYYKVLSNFFRYASAVLMLLIGVLISIFSAYLLSKNNYAQYRDAILFMVAGLLYIALPIRFFLKNHRRFPKLLTPEELINE